MPNRYATLLPGNPKPEDFTLVDFSFYSQHQRCAEKFRVGRILLAADAAHLCNPWGGMGLTGGFADVAGLAECLEGIHAGKADESILDKYDEVRREIFHKVISPISTANYLRVASDPNKVDVLEDPFLKMVHTAKSDPAIKEKLNKVKLRPFCSNIYVKTNLTRAYMLCYTTSHNTIMTRYKWSTCR